MVSGFLVLWFMAHPLAILMWTAEKSRTNSSTWPLLVSTSWVVHVLLRVISTMTWSVCLPLRFWPGCTLRIAKMSMLDWLESCQGPLQGQNTSWLHVYVPWTLCHVWITVKLMTTLSLTMLRWFVISMAAVNFSDMLGPYLIRWSGSLLLRVTLCLGLCLPTRPLLPRIIKPFGIRQNPTTTQLAASAANLLSVPWMVEGRSCTSSPNDAGSPVEGQSPWWPSTLVPWQLSPTCAVD